MQLLLVINYKRVLGKEILYLSRDHRNKMQGNKGGNLLYTI